MWREEEILIYGYYILLNIIIIDKELVGFYV